MTADQHGLNEGRMINGKKVFIQIISGAADLAVVGMHELFRCLAA